MDGRRNVFVLACCQALLLSISVTLVSINALAGFALAPSKALATLPVTTGAIGVALAAFPAAFWIRRVGWRRGFLTGAACGLVGSLVATLGIRAGSFAILCLGTFLLGLQQAFGQYHRFAAVESVSATFRPRIVFAGIEEDDAPHPPLQTSTTSPRWFGFPSSGRTWCDDPDFGGRPWPGWRGLLTLPALHTRPRHPGQGSMGQAEAEPVLV